jgi:hypothetical protein
MTPGLEGMSNKYRATRDHRKRGTNVRISFNSKDEDLIEPFENVLADNCTMNVNSLIGTWKLVSFQSRSKDSTVTYPWGKDTIGYYIFSADGYMNVALMNAKRKQYLSGDMLHGSAEEKIAAAESYLSYAGRYEVRGNKIVVHCEVSFFPNWIGSEQVRFFEFSDDENTLTLSTLPVRIGGKHLTSVLVWQRIVS